MQMNNGIEFLARQMLHVPPENLENTWVTLAGDVKIGKFDRPTARYLIDNTNINPSGACELGAYARFQR